MTIIKHAGLIAFSIILGTSVIVAGHAVERPLVRIEHKLNKALTLSSQLAQIQVALPAKIVENKHIFKKNHKQKHILRSTKLAYNDPKPQRKPTYFPQ